MNFVDPTGLMCSAEFSFSSCGGGGGFWGGGGGFGDHVARYNREYGGLTPRVTGALANHNELVQARLDGILAQHYLDNENFAAAERIFNGNPNVGLYVDGEAIWGSQAAAFVNWYGSQIENELSHHPQRGPMRQPPRRGGGGGSRGGSSRSQRFPGAKDHTRRHQIRGRTLTYQQYIQSAVQHTQKYHKKYLLNHHVNGHNFRRYAYVDRIGVDSFLFTVTSENGRLLFTHMEVNGQYLRNMGINVRSYPGGFNGPIGIP